MSNRCGLAALVALVLFGVLPDGASAGAMAGTAVRSIASAGDAAARFQAPIGHRQPRPSDIPLAAGPSSADSELRRLDEEIDRKLVICRGC
ncbi:hypothetical protein PMI42_06073 [Bradyrhizobium sp. YR681]|nr:hypothetical protein PMI42_06073 [Bradyrhizobium sp. YR681]